MAKCVARVSVNSLLFCLCSNLQLHKIVCIRGLYVALIFLNCEKNVGIIYCEWRTISNTFFWKFVLCPECMYSVVCWCEMITYISGLCYLSIVLNCEWLCFMLIFII